MPIPLECTSCGKKMKAPDKLAGKRVACPGCKQPLSIPVQEDGNCYEVAAAPSKPPTPSAMYQPTEEEIDRAGPTGLPRKKKGPALVTETHSPPLVLRHLHWLLVLTLIPIGISLAQKSEKGERDIEERLEKTLANAPPDVQAKAAGVIQRLETGEADLDELFQVLPERRLVGALLPRGSWMHWLYALVAAALFLSFLLILASQGSANPWHLLLVALFTATAGIAFLFIVQFLAG
ncbi:MAG: hypothetical protein ACJ8FY_04425 [Gemmataceae bacterium]